MSCSSTQIMTSHHILNFKQKPATKAVFSKRSYTANCLVSQVLVSNSHKSLGPVFGGILAVWSDYSIWILKLYKICGMLYLYKFSLCVIERHIITQAIFYNASKNYWVQWSRCQYILRVFYYYLHALFVMWHVDKIYKL